MALMKEGVELYKEIRSDIRQAVPFFPLGFSRITDEQTAYGVRTEKTAYLAVLTPKADHARIPLDFGKEVEAVRVIYPSSCDCDYTYRDGVLDVKMPQTACGRLFAFDLQK